MLPTLRPLVRKIYIERGIIAAPDVDAGQHHTVSSTVTTWFSRSVHDEDATRTTIEVQCSLITTSIASSSLTVVAVV